MAKELYYPVNVDFISEKGESYYMAYLPDFGEAACSACEDTIEEAMLSLRGVLSDVVSYYKESNKNLPVPGPRTSASMNGLLMRVYI